MSSKNDPNALVYVKIITYGPDGEVIEGHTSLTTRAQAESTWPSRQGSRTDQDALPDTSERHALE
jgi:hypothetical protein